MLNDVRSIRTKTYNNNLFKRIVIIINRTKYRYRKIRLRLNYRVNKKNIITNSLN